MMGYLPGGLGPNISDHLRGEHILCWNVRIEAVGPRVDAHPVGQVGCLGYKENKTPFTDGLTKAIEDAVTAYLDDEEAE